MPAVSAAVSIVPRKNSRRVTLSAWENGNVSVRACTPTAMKYHSGAWAATVYKRWGSFRLTLILVGIALVLLAAIWLITVTRSWPEVMGFIVESGVWGLTVVLAVITIAQALGSAAVLRKTTV